MASDEGGKGGGLGGAGQGGGQGGGQMGGEEGGQGGGQMGDATREQRRCMVLGAGDGKKKGVGQALVLLLGFLKNLTLAGDRGGAGRGLGGWAREAGKEEAEATSEAESRLKKEVQMRGNGEGAKGTCGRRPQGSADTEKA